MTTTDDELLALARKARDCYGGGAPWEQYFAVVKDPSAIIALIERHRAEVERLTREAAHEKARADHAESLNERLTRERDGLAAEVLTRVSGNDLFQMKQRAESAETALATVTRERDAARETAYAEKAKATAAETALTAAQKRIADAVAIIDGAHRQRCSGYLRCCEHFYHARDIDGVRAALGGKEDGDAQG